MNELLISVAMPVYNAGVYLEQAIDSIKNQTYSHWEFIIIDDGSTDGAVNELRVKGKLDDKRIKVFSDGKNKGLAARLNECIDLASGDYFARMDADDISLPTRLEEQLDFLIHHPEIDLISTRVEKINFENQSIGSLPYALTHKEICAKPWRSFYMPHPTWMGRLSWFKKFRYANPAPSFCEDQELLLRAYQESKFACIDNVLFKYRVRDKVNFGRTLNTYRAILAFQTSYFLKRNILYTPLSLSVFLLRLLRLLRVKLVG